jgi:hypothetical protein
MAMKVPTFKDPDVTKFLVEMMREVDKRDKDRLSSVTANHSILLQSSDLKVFEVTVTSAGALVVTKVSG